MNEIVNIPKFNYKELSLLNFGELEGEADLVLDHALAGPVVRVDVRIELEGDVGIVAARALLQLDQVELVGPRVQLERDVVAGQAGEDVVLAAQRGRFSVGRSSCRPRHRPLFGNVARAIHAFQCDAEAP